MNNYDNIIVNFYEDDLETLENKIFLIKEYKRDYSVVLHHYSTSIDQGEYIKQNGLMPVSKLFTDENSPLYKFLFNNGIIIDPIKKEIYYDGKWHNLSDSILLCKINNGFDCDSISLFCYDTGSYKSIIKHCPEILVNIDEYLMKKYISSNLCKAWIDNTDFKCIYECVIPAEMIDEFDIVHYYNLYISNTSSDDDFVVCVFNDIPSKYIKIINKKKR